MCRTLIQVSLTAWVVLQQMSDLIGLPSQNSVLVMVEKCEPNLPPEWRKLSVDPQVTTLEVLYSLLAKTFDIKHDFTISYKALDPTSGHELSLSVLSDDFDLDAAFLRSNNHSIMTNSDLCLNLRIDMKPFTEVSSACDTRSTFSIPPSPTSTLYTSMKKRVDYTLLRSIQAKSRKDPVPDEIFLSASSSTPKPSSTLSSSTQHRLLQSDSDDDDEEVPETQEDELDSTLATSGVHTPVVKRFKANDLEEENPNPRKLDYDSDELSQRHPPSSSSGSSSPGSLIYFDLDDDPAPEREEMKLDLSKGSILNQSLRNLSAQLKSKQQESQSNDERLGEAKSLPSQEDAQIVEKQVHKDSPAVPEPKANFEQQMESIQVPSPSPEQCDAPSDKDSYKSVGKVPLGEFLSFIPAAGEKIDYGQDDHLCDDLEDSSEPLQVEQNAEREEIHSPVKEMKTMEDKLPEDSPEADFATDPQRESKEETSHSPDRYDAPSEENSFKFVGEIPPGQFLGFMTAAGEKIDCGQDDHFWDDLEDSPEVPQVDENGDVNRNIQVIEKAIPSKVREHSESMDRDHQSDLFGDSEDSDSLIANIAKDFSQMAEAPRIAPATPEFVGFMTAAGNIIEFTDEELKKAKEWDRELEIEANPLMQLFFEREQTQKDSRLEQEYLIRLLAMDEMMAAPRPIEYHSPESVPLSQLRPKMNASATQSSCTQEISAAVSAVMQDSQAFMSQFTMTVFLKETVEEKRRKHWQRVHNARRNMLLAKVSEQMKEERDEFLRYLESLSGEEKPEELRKPFRSEFIEKKLNRRGKTSLRESFGPIISVQTKSRLSELQFHGLLDHQFNAMEFQSNEEIVRNYQKGIPIGHFLVPTTDTFMVGVRELEMAFFAGKGIDPKLVSREWFENAWKLILWKLVSMELHLEEEWQGELFTLENVLNQLHYRYYQEIDCSKRSILRECLEMDEAPGRPMVLVVVDLLRVDELLLSDGHYTVRTMIDELLERQVESGRIRRGIKLLIDSADFVNLDQGYAPLEVPASVALRIHGNSTRRCKWDTRLGRFYGRQRLKVSLSGVDQNGGLISAVDVLVIRKYPPLFVSENRHRNERMHRVYRKQLEMRHFNLYERLYHKFDREVVQEEEEARKQREMPQYNSISEITEAEHLYHIVASTQSFDVDQLTEKQSRVLKEFREKMLRERTDEVDRRINAAIANDLTNQSVLLRMKVADLKSPSLSNCAELSIWNPSEELDRVIKDGTAVCLENVHANGMRYNILQLKTSRRFNCKEVRRDKKEHKVVEKSLARHLTRLSDISDMSTFTPTFLEFDTVVIVLKVGERVADKFQHVFCTDDQSNVICLNFWDGLQQFCLESIVRPGQIIAVSNVQWRLKSNTFNLPNGYVIELTVVTTSPRRVEMVEEMEKYQQFLQDRPLQDLLGDVAKKHPIVAKIPSEPTSTIGISGSTATVQSPVIKTPLRPTATFVTPGISALQTPLIERQINLLANVPSDTFVFQSPKTPISTRGVRKKRKCMNK